MPELDNLDINNTNPSNRLSNELKKEQVSNQHIEMSFIDMFLKE